MQPPATLEEITGSPVPHPIQVNSFDRRYSSALPALLRLRVLFSRHPGHVNRNNRLVANHPSVVSRRDHVRLAGTKNNAVYLVLTLSWFHNTAVERQPAEESGLRRRKSCGLALGNEGWGHRHDQHREKYECVSTR